MSPEVADLLWLGHEDVSGLWEISWGPEDDGPGGPRRVDVIVSVLRSGLIELAAGPSSSDFDTAPRLGPEARALLRDPRCWQGPDPGDDIGAHVVRFATTDAGFAAFRTATGWDRRARARREHASMPSPSDPAGTPVWENYVVAQLTQASLSLVPRDAAALGVEVDDVDVTVVCQARNESPGVVEGLDEIVQELSMLLGEHVRVGSRVERRDAPTITPHDRTLWTFAAREDR
ncbi:hypothetical protein [Isoptericola cucumis]|uniref:Uncharacterized protein n=1 Tax=Isoptericola cucumis TaxID=1776856 RepID=A0ABQ2BF01_9MICO|nr:hypothetical protein [Isoptericola cucumis]GGI12215.1 hypothetical protein GCM10007368_40050 [Isoptericola cucumis]